jgi:hypothetical protein
MNYKIYQVYYKKEQKKFLNPEFFPFDNTSNKRPDLLEYYIFHIGYKKVMSENLSHWGFVSWRWNEKCKIKSQEVIVFIDQNPNQDVYLMNWTPYYESINWNVWSHGESCHSGIISIVLPILKEMGYDEKIIHTIMPRNVFCFSSYFVASKKFWKDYLIFLKKFKNIVDNDSALKLQIFKKEKYLDESEMKYHTNYSLFPFIVERLFSTFLTINYDSYAICNYPYDFQSYEKYVGESYKDIQKCSDLKMKIWEDTKNFESKYSSLWGENRTKLYNTKNLIPD